jgi:glutamyl/glutaminyl-tRNA synthetase
MRIARLPSRRVTRFAPAPTGFLHLGHVVNAVYVWGVAERGGGAVRLRIEDHDRQRSRPEFAAAILEDLINSPTAVPPYRLTVFFMTCFSTDRR